MPINDIYKTTRLPTWCPGCGDFGIWASLKNALSELKLTPEKIAFVFDIGCNSNMYDATKVTSFEGLHGRTLPVAEGIRSANNNLPVVCVTGDGGCLGEGGNHFIHAARRNYDISLFIHDNQVYGLTTGQTSPTTFKNTKTKSNPTGVIEYPINPLLLALSCDATFVARGFSGDIPGLTKLIIKAINHKGFSVLDILQPCVTFNHLMSYAWYRERIYYLTDEHTTNDKMKAIEKSLEFPIDINQPPTEGHKIPLGVFYDVERPMYEDELYSNKGTALVEQPINDIHIDTLIKEFE